MGVAMLPVVVRRFHATLVFTSNRDGNQELYALDIDSGAQHRLTNDPGAEYSRDGSKIIWNREPAGG